MTREEARDKWLSYMADTGGEQPYTCIFDDGVCGYPVDDCENCPVNPNNLDPYWGLSKARFL